MKLGVMLPMFSGDPRKALAAAREAEALGYDGAFVFDHFFPPGAPPDRPALEAFATLAAVAAATDRITVGTLVTRVSLRPAGMLAKTAAWIDAASGGRLVLGVGTGDPIDRPEHEAYGIPMKGRRERREELEESVAALKALFGGRRFPGGRHVPALDGPLSPRPATPGGPPIWVGAQADEVVRIAGRLADGWNGWGMAPDRFRAKAGLLADAAGGRPVEATWAGIVLAGADQAETATLLERRRARGLDDEAWVGTADELAAFLQALAEAGAGWAVLVLAGPADRRRLVAERVLPALERAATPS
ncbi:MAG TPA: LLM class flavin-dependent oxidoreductase [Actinomycetota bacterium]|nr:LLM class flavin-dependent oxidoreductase [Actinomycetota bacterium]